MLFNGFPTFYGDLSSCVLYWEKVGSRQIVYTPGILPVASKDLENAFLRETMSCTSFTEISEKWSYNEQFGGKNGPEKGFMVL